MIGIGWTEMLVIGVVALIFIGPKELPALMSKMGKAVGAIRRMGNEFQREINRSTGLETVTDLRKTFTDPIKKTTAEIAREFNKITPTGVEPSGAIKPADPNATSVVKEIRAAAGLETPAAPVKTAAVGVGAAAMAGAAPAAAAPAPAPAKPADAAPDKPATTRVKAAPRAKAAPTHKVDTADLFPVTPPAPPPEPVAKTPKPRARKPIESPAPAETLAPAKPPRKRRPAAAKAAPEAEKS